MASDRFILTRPIEITASNNTLTVDRGGGAAAVNLTVGVYGCIAMVMDELEDQLIAEQGAPGWTATLTTDFYVTIANADDFTIVWTDDALRLLLGFDAFGGPAVTSETGARIPEYCWLPLRVRGNQDAWHPNLKERIRTAVGQSGLESGLSTGAEHHRIKLLLPHEYGYNLLKAECRTALEQVRCLETFVEGSRISYPSTGNTSVGGFYFWNDYTDLDEESSMTVGDVTTFKYTTAPGEYAFCIFEPGWEVPTQPGHKSNNDFRTVTLPIRTSKIPVGGWVSL